MADHMTREAPLPAVTRSSTANQSAKGADTSRYAASSPFDSSENIKVLVRVRPAVAAEAGDPICVNLLDATSLAVNNADNTKSFQCSYDAVLGPSASQLDVYKTVRECTLSVLDGVNATVFAYGQTNSGKTYSMYGPAPEIDGEGRASHLRSSSGDQSLIGVIPRAIQEIFDLGQQKHVISFTVYCSFVQIYNEGLYDMLRDTTMANSLSIREDGKEIYVQGLSEYQVKTVADMLSLLRLSEEHRSVRETHMNQFSSRSHSLFQILIEQKRVAADGGEVELRSKFNLVDLAGSEKWNIRAQMRDEHINEMTNINLSLHTLGRCIAALAARDKLPQAKRPEVHVPYRDSKLTRLLQDSLGGNSKTFLIATISPARMNAEESISTLKFADRAKQVMIQARVNEIRPVDHALVLRLQKEVEYLKDLLRKFVDSSTLESLNLSFSHIPDNRMLANPSDPSNVAGNEIEKMRRLILENESLRSELQELRYNNGHAPQLHSMRGAASSSSSNKDNRRSQDAALIASPTEASHPTTAAENFIRGLKEAWQGQSSRFWDRFDQMEIILNKFFRFEIEEDAMRTLLTQLLSSTHQLRGELLVPEALLRRLISNYEGELKTSSTDAAALYASEESKSTSHLPQEERNQPPSLILRPSVSKLQAMKKFTGRLDRLPASSTPTIPSPQAAATADMTTAPATLLLQSSSSPTLPAAQHSFPMIQQESFSRSSASVTALQEILSASKADGSIFDHPILPLNSQQRLDLQNVSFRVRTSSKNIPSVLTQSHDKFNPAAIAAQAFVPIQHQAVDEEELLQRELKKRERRLQKQMHLQEQIRQRKEKQIEQQRTEEEEKQAVKEAEIQKEVRRKQRAEKLKKQLVDYETKIKAEAEQIEALRRLGIDPASILKS